MEDEEEGGWKEVGQGAGRIRVVVFFFIGLKEDQQQQKGRIFIFGAALVLLLVPLCRSPN